MRILAASVLALGVLAGVVAGVAAGKFQLLFSCNQLV